MLLHFNDNEPTSAWPDPTKKLGYELGKSKQAKSPRAAPKRDLTLKWSSNKDRKHKRKHVAPHTDSMPDIEVTDPVDDTVSQVESEDHLGIPEAVPYLKPLLQDHDYINTTWDSTPPAKISRPESTCTSRNDIALHDHDYAEPSTSSSENCSECSKKEDQLMEMNGKLKKLEQKVKNLKRLPKRSVSYDITNVVLKSDKTVKDYTGIESRDKFEALHTYVEPRVKKLRYWTGTKKESSPRSSPRAKRIRTPQKPGPARSLNSRQEFILVLMKLRLALTVSFLAGLFHITSSTVSQIFNTWIKFLAADLKPLIHWPDKLSIQMTMPKSLQKKYQHLRCTLDCTEVFIGRPRNLANQARTWSDYKKHNTVKFLVAIAPNGMISFLSHAWGGRASDVLITRKSGILELIDPGDVVLVDRGFLIKEDLLLRGAKLEMPPPSKGKEQQTPGDVAKTKKIANARIHVERAIGRIKWFGILKETLPISLVPLIDDIVVVCAALVNLRSPLVK
nr:uncharacterized protein LOC129267165 [Lytechinus pictus]